jgi:hypothetical protein
VNAAKFKSLIEIYGIKETNKTAIMDIMRGKK